MIKDYAFFGNAMDWRIIRKKHISLKISMIAFNSYTKIAFQKSYITVFSKMTLKCKMNLPRTSNKQSETFNYLHLVGNEYITLSFLAVGGIRDNLNKIIISSDCSV